jgi:hypothetical protein
MMKKNMGRADRSLRVLVAAGAVAGSGVLGFTTAWGIVLLVAAAIMILTSTRGSCPLYSIVRINTMGRGDAQAGDSQVLRRAA